MLGFGYHTLYNWRRARRIPDYAYQNSMNLLALQEIALLEPGATMDDAVGIARQRLEQALSTIPEPRQRKTASPRRVAEARRSGRMTEERAWEAVRMHNQGRTNDQIADHLGCSMRTVQKMLKSVLGSYQPVRLGRPPRSRERELA